MKYLAPKIKFILVAIATILTIIINAPQVKSNPPIDQNRLPALQAHKLPPSLSQWEDYNQVGDYFEAIKPSVLGYLIWSEFPIKIYLDRPEDSEDQSASKQRFSQWVTAVETAIQEWNHYLPLSETSSETEADIIIKRALPPVRAKVNPETGLLNIPRARNGETSYYFYWRNRPDKIKILAHKMTIYLSPNQNPDYTLTTIRHELGHALGIWGHSSVKTDALYYSQVSDPVSVSDRDLNTLKKIYQQPTRLGWMVSPQCISSNCTPL
jgi:predicted Zn-dependent protease